MRRPCAAILLTATSIVALAACGGGTTSTSAATTTAPPNAISIRDPWCRVTPAMTDTGVCYATVENGTSHDVALVAASVPASVAAQAQLHETTGDTNSTGDMVSNATGMGGATTGDSAGMLGMQEVPQIDVPAGQTVVLEPGGFHIMLLQLVAPLQASQAVPVTVTFADGSSQTVTATVRDG